MAPSNCNCIQELAVLLIGLMAGYATPYLLPTIKEKMGIAKDDDNCKGRWITKIVKIKL